MKKTLYIALSTFLGVLLSFLLHAVIEYLYIRNTSDELITWNNSFGKGSCALPEWLQLLLILIGVVGGITMGFWWWKIVYVQKRHWRIRNKENN